MERRKNSKFSSKIIEYQNFAARGSYFDTFSDVRDKMKSSEQDSKILRKEENKNNFSKVYKMSETNSTDFSKGSKDEDEEDNEDEDEDDETVVGYAGDNIEAKVVSLSVEKVEDNDKIDEENQKKVVIEESNKTKEEEKSINEEIINEQETNKIIKDKEDETVEVKEIL